MRDPEKRPAELIDLFDKDRLPLRRTIQRGQPLPKNTYRLVVHIFVFNKKGEMLIQQRQSSKKFLPDKWDLTAGGQVIRGECSSMGAERELSEELGIKIDFSSFRPKMTMNFDEGFDDIYILTADVDLNTLTLQEDEVQNVAWADCDTVLSMINDGIFVPYHETYIRQLFAMQDLNGTFDDSSFWTDVPKPDK